VYAYPPDSPGHLLPTPWLTDDLDLIQPLGRQLDAGRLGQFVVGNDKPLLDARRSDIDAVLAEAVKTGSAGDEGADQAPAVIVYLAAAGVVKDGTAYLLPNDWPLAATDNPETKWVSLKHVLDKLSEVKSPKLLLLLNWATPRYVGKGVPWDEMASFAEAAHQLLQQRQDQQTLPFHVIFACSPGEESLPLAVEGTSVFGYFVTQGLRGEAARPGGPLSVGQLTEFLCDESGRVNRWARYNTGRAQRPKHYATSASRDFEIVHNLPPGPPKTPSSTEPSKPPESVPLPADVVARKTLGVDRYAAWMNGWKRCEDLGLPQLVSTLSGVHSPPAQPKELISPPLRRLVRALHDYESVALRHHGHPGAPSTGGDRRELWNDRLDETYQKAPPQVPVVPSGDASSMWVWTHDGLPDNLGDLLLAAVAKGVDSKTTEDKLREFLSKDAVRAHPRQAAALCWDTLVEKDGDFTTVKLFVVDLCLKRLLGEQPPQDRGELLVLTRAAEYYRPGQSTYNPEDPGEKELHTIMMDAIHSWLRVEHAAQQVARVCRAAGGMIQESQKKLEECDKLYREAMVQDGKEMVDMWRVTQPKGPAVFRVESRLVNVIHDRLKQALHDYQVLLRCLEEESVSSTVLARSIAQLQATAELALRDGLPLHAERWIAWGEAVQDLDVAVRERRADANAKSRRIDTVREAYFALCRDRLEPVLKRFQKSDDPNAKKPASPAEPGKPAPPSSKDRPTAQTVGNLEFALSADFWTVDQRQTLIAVLTEAQERLHESFLVEPNSGTATPPPPGPTGEQKAQIRKLLTTWDVPEVLPDSKTVDGSTLSAVLANRRLPWPDQRRQ